MLRVRLQRTGKRGQAYFRVVVLEHTKKPKGEFLELLGNYDPHKKEFKVKMERIEYWVSKGAQVSPTVNNLLVNYKYWDKPKMTSWKPKNRGNAEGTEKTETPTMETQKKTEATEVKTREALAEEKSAEEPKKEETSAEPQSASIESSGEAKPEAQPAA